MTRWQRQAAARRRRELWAENPFCRRCGKPTDPHGLKADKPKLAMVDGAEILICCGCLTGGGL